MDLKEKKILELGCGTGLISIWCAKKGAEVTASDVNPEAVATTDKNALVNNAQFQTIQSDLFQNIKENFDFIIINPPYYAKEPITDAEKAWYCGSNFEYFERLFSDMKSHIEKGTTVLMVLSDNCEIEIITDIAIKNSINFKQVYQKRYLTENNYIFQLITLPLAADIQSQTF